MTFDYVVVKQSSLVLREVTLMDTVEKLNYYTKSLKKNKNLEVTLSVDIQ